MSNSPFYIVSFCATFIFVYMTSWFLIAMAIKRNDIADIAWGLGFSTLSVIVPHNGQLSQDIVIRLLIILWGVRLSYHVFTRNSKRSEDYRYLSWRLTWGKWFALRSYLQIFLLQGFFMLLIATPLIISSKSINPPHPVFYWIGIFLWLIGFLFESIGDWQLAKFLQKKKLKGSIMNTGLWRYSRHPNYFGEVTQWWGIFLIVLTQTDGIFGIISPITITALIIGISGIPMLEKKYEGNPAFEQYKRTTSPFFPWVPKK